MADKNVKNVPGKYYVNGTCIDCGLCYQSTPDFFAKDPDSGLAYVLKQPDTEQEIIQCEEALENCPVQAIGNDG